MILISLKRNTSSSPSLDSRRCRRASSFVSDMTPPMNACRRARLRTHRSRRRGTSFNAASRRRKRRQSPSLIFVLIRAHLRSYNKSPLRNITLKRLSLKRSRPLTRQKPSVPSPLRNITLKRSTFTSLSCRIITSLRCHPRSRLSRNHITITAAITIIPVGTITPVRKKYPRTDRRAT